MRKLITSFVLIVLFTNLSHAQSQENLKDINAVWAKFYKAFETLDYTLMADIHSKDLLRISNGSNIIDYDTYINNYESRFNFDKENNQTNHISLRFFERINSASTASERGIYRLIRNKGTEDEQVYYGQFHVIFKKVDDTWKITMDYDSTESNTTSEEHYNKAFAINNIEQFSRN